MRSHEAFFLPQAHSRFCNCKLGIGLTALELGRPQEPGRYVGSLSLMSCTNEHRRNAGLEAKQGRHNAEGRDSQKFE